MKQSGDRTEKATPKRRREARERGQVIKSHDLSAALHLLSILVLIQVLSQSIGSSLKRIMGDSLALVEMDQPLTIQMVKGHYAHQLLLAGQAVLPLLAMALVMAILPGMAQTRLLFTTKPLEMKLDKLNPIHGFKRLFSIRSTIEVAKSLVKIIIVVAVSYKGYQEGVEEFTGLLRYPAIVAVPILFSQIMRLAIRLALILVLFGILDYVYQWWMYEKDLRMTKQEIKDEYKLTEGNPQIKGRIRQVQRMMASRRMMQAVPEATVVVTNPTHFAVALRYQAGKDTAPVVLAKGQDLIAQKIKEIARDKQVILVENRPLARSLFASCEIGAQIPPELYGAVAEVLAYVIKIKEGKRP